jgi:hypothetical protein
MDDKTKQAEQKARIEEIFARSQGKIQQLGEQAITILRTIRRKREEKKIADISKELQA